MSEKKALERMFDIYSKNLTLCNSEAQDIFVCPFCRHIFRKDAVTGDPKKVIAAHCTLDSLGGNLKTLACARCDNEAGRVMDSHLKNRYPFCERPVSRAGRSRNNGFRAGVRTSRCDVERRPNGQEEVWAVARWGRLVCE